MEEEFNDISDIEDEPSEYICDTNNNADLSSRQDFPLRDDTSTLRNLLDSKTRELEHLSTILQNERKQHESSIDEYKKRIVIENAEKERAIMNRNQTHELLVEHKQTLMSKNEENQTLKAKIKLLETENDKLVGELESTKLMLSDVQSKYHMVEKNSVFNAERNADQIIKQAQERHTAQITMMQQQIDGIKSKYDDLEHEHKHMEIRYKELQRSREAILIEKGQIINQLNRNLEDSQRQVQEILSRPDTTEENRRLQNSLRIIEHQKEELSQTLNKVQKKLHEKSSELEIMENVLHEYQASNASAEMSKFIENNFPKNSNASTPLSSNHDERLSKVKEDLFKSVHNIKVKREEIKILEQQLTEKDKEITELRHDENKNLIELNKYRDEVMRLESKICALQGDYDLIIAENSKLLTAKNELEKKKFDLEELDTEMKKISLEENEELKSMKNENETLRNKLSDLQKEVEIVTSESSRKSEEYITKINELELAALQLQNSNMEYIKELENVRKSLTEAEQTIKSLEHKLNLQNLRDQEIEKLQNKAREFEEFMRSNLRFGSSPSTHSQSSSSTNNPSKVDAFTEIENSDLSIKHPLRNQEETKIRNEMAKIFANQISTVEKKFTSDIKKMQNLNVQLSSFLKEEKERMQIAMEQLDILKFTIVSEREEFKTLIEQKDNNIEHYRTQVEMLNEKIDIIYEERDSIERLKTQIEKDRLELNKREEKLQQEYTKAIEELNEKYKSAKKTAQTYKQVNIFF